MVDASAIAVFPKSVWLSSLPRISLSNSEVANKDADAKNAKLQ